jgi:hypothetical protein
MVLFKGPDGTCLCMDGLDGGRFSSQFSYSLVLEWITLPGGNRNRTFRKLKRNTPSFKDNYEIRQIVIDFVLKE